MGWYERTVFPCLCDLALDRPFVADYRRQLLANVCGAILEIGLGTGLNLSCYPPQVRRIATVEPSAGMLRRARRRIDATGIEVDCLAQGGETLPFENDTFDFVVSTFTLCTIGPVERALAEFFRVLKPGGRFLFLEHGLSPDPKVQKWQHRLNWLQMHLAGGCHLDRDMKMLVSAQPFASVEVDTFYMDKTPQTHGFMFRGAGTK